LQRFKILSNKINTLIVIIMAQIELSIPVIVRQIKENKEQNYQLSPLFFSNPVISNRRFDQAKTIFSREIRQHFKNFSLSRQNAAELLWYLFNPKVKHKIIRMEFSAGKQFIKGDFSIIYFELQDKIFVCLPSFNSYVFLAQSNRPELIFEQSREVIDKLVRLYKKNADADTWDMTPHYAVKGEFVSTIDFTVQSQEGEFEFENANDADFFAFFGGLENFDGAEELDKVARNYNDIPINDLPTAFYRETLVKQLINTFYQVDKTPLVIIGNEGVGKHTIIQNCVKIYREEWASRDTGVSVQQQFWHLDPTRVISGMSIVGMWQRRFEAIIKQLLNRIKEHQIGQNKNYDGRTDNLLIDNAVALLRIGKSAQNSMTLSDVLKPYLEKRQLQITLIATPEEWKIVQERDRRFADLFQVIRVTEPNYETSVKMILQQRKMLELRHNTTITVSAIRQLFNIHRNYFKRKSLPGNVAKLLTQLSVKYSSQTIDNQQVQAEFKNYSGLRLEIFDDQYTLEEQELEKHIASKLIGQPQAVGALANVIHQIKAKLNNPYKPLGSFLFIGPTGVGKTEAAKIVCEYLLGSADKLMRFDMNEYVDDWAVSRLIGDYYNPEGQLTGKIRHNPFGVLLFDEIEKAAPKVHDLLLQVLDDGRLTDSIGRTVDFSNTIIIMTSNIGAQQVGTKLGFDTGYQNEGAIYNKAVENFFRPEFINRIDKILNFNNLELSHILNIAKLQINNLLSRDGFVRRTTILNIEPAALDWVAKRGFNSKMGGRALKRQIEKDLTVFTAEQLVKTSLDQPVIFDIKIENEQLRPNIEILRFVEPLAENWLPFVPEETELKPAYHQLIRDIEKLEKLVSYSNNSTLADKSKWLFYAFLEQLNSKKEKVNRMIMGMRSSYVDNISPNLFRLKGAGTKSIIYKNDTRKKDAKLLLAEDRLFQQSALEEISYVYQHAPEQFDKSQSLFLEDFLDTEFYKIIATAVKEQKLEKMSICFRSMITNLGADEIEYLAERYTQLCEHLGLGTKYDKKTQKIELEGYGIAEILHAEQGYHFFYRSHQNPIPIKLWLQKANETITAQTNVVRLYDIWLGKNHKSSTITDLRAGLTNQANINPQEFKMLLFAGLQS
jgi:ATP-dependent Clp protease ATP-binding subunit ClpC